MHSEGENMAALDTTARHKGYNAMEAAISAAAGVRRQLKAGRPRTGKGSLKLNAYEAMGVLVNQAEGARGLMSKAGLNPEDISLRLIMRTGAGMLLKKLPSPEKAQPFFESVCDTAGAQFLGILWEQTDRDAEAKGKPGITYWVTPFVTEPDAQRQMLALLELIRAGGTQVLSN